MVNTDTNTDTDVETDADTDTALSNRRRYPRARARDSTEGRSSDPGDDFGTLVTRAAHAAGSALWLAVQAVFVGLTAIVAILRDEDSRLRTQRWLLMEGNRWTIIGIVTVGVFFGIMLLGVTGIIGIRQSGFVTGLFGALISGVISFIAIVLSINQLAVSRLVGSTESARKRITDVREFRAKIAERIPEQEILPTEPSAFMSIVAGILLIDVEDLREAIRETEDAELARVIDEYLTVITEQTESLNRRLHEGQKPLVTPLVAILVSMTDNNYSKYINVAHWIQAQYADSLSDEATERLTDLRELFTSLSITRQYFKVLYINQAFGRLSRQLTYTGLGAILAAALVILGFSTGYAPLRNEFVVLIFVSIAFAVTVLPLVVFFVYILRIATLLKRSSAPGPFTPEGEKPEYAEYPDDRLDRFFDHDKSPYRR